MISVISDSTYCDPVVSVVTSVVDPSTLNLDTGPDRDPGLCYQF